MSALLQYLLESGKRDRFRDWVGQQYGQSNPELVGLADANPELAQSIIGNMMLASLDPEKQAKQNQRNAAIALAMGEPEQERITWNGPRVGGFPEEQPQREASFLPPQGGALAAYANQQPQIAQTGNAGGLSKRQEALLAIADPNKYMDYIVSRSDPEKISKIQKENLERQQTFSKLDQSYQDANQGFDQVENTINRIIGDKERKSKISNWTAGIGQPLSYIPGTGARDLEADLNTIKGNVAFSALQQMRANSPTGGALGNVSDTETKLLSSTLGSIDQAQSPEQLEENLNIIKKTIQGSRERLKTAYERDRVNFGGSPALQQMSRKPDLSQYSTEQLLQMRRGK